MDPHSTSTNREAPLARLEAESAIRAALARYARGVDRRDSALIRSAYVPGARDEHGGFSGTIEEFVDWYVARHESEGIVQSMHLFGNPLIDFVDASNARVETNCHYTSQQRSADQDADTLRETRVLCRYVDAFTAHRGTWAIANRVVIYERFETIVVSADVSRFAPEYTVQVHGRDDASYALLARA